MAQIVFVPAAVGGSGGASYTFVQSTPADTWIINHNLGYQPVIELFSVGGLVIEGTILHTSVNQAQVTYLLPVAGSARCM